MALSGKSVIACGHSCHPRAESGEAQGRHGHAGRTDPECRTQGAAGDRSKKKYGEAPFLHEHIGKYYFTFSTGWPGQILYTTASSPLGPFTYGDVVIDYLKISTNHQAIIEHDGKSYIFYHDNLLPGGGGYRRSIAVAPLEYDAQGGIKPVQR